MLCAARRGPRFVRGRMVRTAHGVIVGTARSARQRCQRRRRAASPTFSCTRPLQPRCCSAIVLANPANPAPAIRMVWPVVFADRRFRRIALRERIVVKGGSHQDEVCRIGDCWGHAQQGIAAGLGPWAWSLRGRALQGLQGALERPLRVGSAQRLARRRSEPRLPARVGCEWSNQRAAAPEHAPS